MASMEIKNYERLTGEVRQSKKNGRMLTMFAGNTMISF